MGQRSGVEAKERQTEKGNVMQRLKGKTALVTGGNSGIGFGTARRLVAEGAFVYITGRNQERLDSSVAQLGDQARALRADNTKPSEMRGAIDRIRAERGSLDIVFANAGAVYYNTIQEMSEENLDLGLAVDLKGTIFTVHAALALLSDGGSVIVNTSIPKDMGLPRFGVYAAAKAGLRSLVRTWTNELRGRRIRVNAVSPGVTQTEMFEQIMGVKGAAEYVARVIEEIPSGRVGNPEDIGNAVVFLASEEASFINGIELTVDGGQTQVYAGHN
jgi:NAD(P)-dependent dehydrogenase (short-subunit alcohol dehydrogenase family)